MLQFLSLPVLPLLPPPQKYPNSRIVGLSNSNSQREYIMGVAEKKGFKNLTIHTGNVVEFDFCTVDPSLKCVLLLSLSLSLSLSAPRNPPFACLCFFFFFR
jgi:hypothetical protein